MCDSSENKECRNCKHYSKVGSKCYFDKGFKVGFSSNPDIAPNLHVLGKEVNPTDSCEYFEPLKKT